ncbi:thioredoxin fold domain-containing protein [Novispirillum sp. DQ9]|uniref:thioredoxin fold domain-containing protein n=1 Tax=Novispirillum sp. DQ9 TaxID=3398612 RepID=UPI003C7DE03D
MTRRVRFADLALGLRLRFRACGLLAVALLFLMAAPAPAGAAELIYYHGPACPYCQEWDAEVAPIYANTEEGARLPLRRVSSDAPLPADLAHLKGLVFTPTFVVLDDSGREVGRIAGYQPDWFWAFLRKYIARMDAAAEAAREG